MPFDWLQSLFILLVLQVKVQWFHKLIDLLIFSRDNIKTVKNVGISSLYYVKGQPKWCVMFKSAVPSLKFKTPLVCSSHAIKIVSVNLQYQQPLGIALLLNVQLKCYDMLFTSLF